MANRNRCEQDFEIVVSGMSGKFPSCENFDEFKQKLFDGVEMTSEEPWGIDDGSVPKRLGTLKSNCKNKFDATFFALLPQIAETTDPNCRLILETAFEAILDAGVNPRSVMGSKCGVYLGAIIPESSQAMNEPPGMRYPLNRSCFSVAQSFMANRVSFFLDLKGPSMVIDAGCSSSLFAMHCAIADIQNGVCDSALVGAVNTIDKPFLTQTLKEAMFLAPDGRCKSFDARCDGFVRSEAVLVLFIQKKHVARRSYCKLYQVAVGNDGFKEVGIACTSGTAQAQLFREFYDSCGVDPLLVGYIEGHGPGTKAGDPEEVQAMDAVFNKGRSEPLTIGSVKTNMGHTEAVAGLCSLAKIIIAMETGEMPGTLHYQTPNPDIPALVSGRIKINNKKTPFDETYCAVNSFGMGGGICHMLVKRDSKAKQPLKDVDLPMLVCCSGRTEDAVTIILKQILYADAIDTEFIGLLHEVFSETMTNHPYRGYIVVDKRQGLSDLHVEKFSGQPRPVCFFLSGMGSQWPAMGKQMMGLPIFRESIDRSAAILESKAVDLYRIIGSDEPGIFQLILNSFVGITAIQIALLDVLAFLGIKPDYIIGHSFGEVACAYGDGSFTAEEALLTSYYRGLVSVETVLPPGAMAVIGLGYEEIKNRVPEGVEIACHNSPDSCTISGRKQAIKTYCEILTKKGAFVSQLTTSGIAYHSSLLAPAGTKFLAHLKKLLPDPKKKSEKWISTCIAVDEAQIELEKYSSAEYHCHNFLNPVLFEENFMKIPKNAIVIEIAPHGLMQRILNSFPGRDHINIPLMDKTADDNLHFFFSSVGRLYEAGVSPAVSKLYPAIRYPVSRGTPMISPLIRWDHSIDWPSPSVYEDEALEGIKRFNVNPKDPSNIAYRVQNSLILPYARVLVLVWEALAAMSRKKMWEMDVIFTDVEFLNTVFFEGFQLKAIIHSEDFYVLFNKQIVAKGKVVEGRRPFRELGNKTDEERQNSNIYLSLQKDDIYKELKLRGIIVSEHFQVIQSIDHSFSVAQVKAAGDWVKDLESFFHFATLQSPTRAIYRPTSIKQVVVTPSRGTLTEQDTFQIRHAKDVLSCNIIEMVDLKFRLLKEEINQTKEPVLEKYEWCPHLIEKGQSEDEGLEICLQVVAENLLSLNVRSLEIVAAGKENEILSPKITEIFRTKPGIQYEPAINGVKALPNMSCVHNLLATPKNYYQLIVSAAMPSNTVEKLEHLLHPDGFLLLQPTAGTPCSLPGFTTCVQYDWAKGRLLLLRKKHENNASKIIDMSDEEGCEWLKPLQESVKNEKFVVLVSRNPTSGIIGFINSFLRESYKQLISGFLIMDNNAPLFSTDLKFYSDQLAKGLVLNVLKNGIWGTFRFFKIHQQHLPFEHVLWKSNSLIQGPINRLANCNKSTVTVYYSVDLSSTEATSNFSQNEHEKYLAGFSGRRSNGSRVMGVTVETYASVTSVITPPSSLCWDVPIAWSLRDAATVPFVYCQALMCLQHLRHNPAIKSVLISGADSSPIGCAVAKIAKCWDLAVYAICSNSTMQQLLQYLVPEMDSTEVILKNELYVRLESTLVNTIVDLDGDISYRDFLQIGGNVVHLNKCKNEDNDLNLKDVRHLTLDFLSFLEDEKNQHYLNEELQQILDFNIVPLLNKVSKLNNEFVEDSERREDECALFVKLFKWRDQEKLVGSISPSLTWQANPRCWFDPLASYVLIGGLGGFGLELANWMAGRGARNIVFCSRSGIKEGYQAYRVRCLNSAGVSTTILTHDITTGQGIERILKESMTIGTVAGIFHLALTPEDGILEDLNENIFKKGNTVKMQVCQYLHRFSKQLCPDLKHFVMFSSYAAGHGLAGFLSYAYSNSRMERLCERRAEQGLPAKALAWGTIGDVGVMTRSQVNVIGVDLQPISNCLAVLDILLLEQCPVVSSFVLKDKTAAVDVKTGSTILERVCELLGTRDFKGISSETTLAQMGMDSILSALIRKVLDNEFNMKLTIPEIRCLSVRTLKELDSN